MFLKITVWWIPKLAQLHLFKCGVYLCVVCTDNDSESKFRQGIKDESYLLLSEDICSIYVALFSSMIF
jgi:hypothetical protein